MTKLDSLRPHLHMARQYYEALSAADDTENSCHWHMMSVEADAILNAFQAHPEHEGLHPDLLSCANRFLSGYADWICEHGYPVQSQKLKALLAEAT